MFLRIFEFNLNFFVSEYILIYEGLFNFCFFNQSIYYGIYLGGGVCVLDLLLLLNKQFDWIMVVVGEDDYQQLFGCGMCIEIMVNGE